jgi:hypothetical protein
MHGSRRKLSCLRVRGKHAPADAVMALNCALFIVTKKAP